MSTGNNGTLDGIRKTGPRYREVTVEGVPGAALGFRLRGATQYGSPAAGTWRTGDVATDRAGSVWTCTAGGTPGTWVPAGPRWASILSYGADPTGTRDSTTAIQNALLSYGTLGSWSQGQGGIVYVPPGNYLISKTLIIPSGVILQGSGWGTQITLATNSGCDMIQWATYQSSSQATVLGVSTTAIANAFYSGVRDIALHGDAFSATTPAYFNGITITTSPVSTAAGSDPEFDPLQTIENVYIKACTGDGVNQENARSGAFLKRVVVESCNGVSFAVGTDTTLVDCLAAFCSSGFYLNHTSNLGVGCKSYNHGIGQWVSGHAYTTGFLVIYSGAMYWCTASVTSATVPSSDPTHWTAVSAATAAQADGNGWYFDVNAGEHSWSACDAQENNTSAYYVKGANNGAINIDGTSAGINFNNSQPDYNSANPNHYAALVLDGVTGVNARISTKTNSAGNGIVCTSLNSPGSNTLIAVTDGTEAAVFNGGTPSFALVNGSVQSVLTATQAVVAGAVTLTFSSSITPVASAGDRFIVTLTGNTTMNAPTSPPSGSAATQTITFELIQDTTGSRLVTWNSVFNFGTAGAPTLTTTVSKRDLVGFSWSPSQSKWLYVGITQGL